jgi:uncharacterized protein (TIGR02145 family)
MKLFSVLLVVLGVFLFASCQKEIPDSNSFQDKRDGRIYRTLEIGTQTWMAENLAYLPSVSPSSDGSDTSPYYYVYDYEGSSVSAAKASLRYTTYGVLYNWEAARTACPTGWHLPSDAEWTVLEHYLIDNGFGFEGWDLAIGKSMASTSGWDISDKKATIGNNQATNNLSGFNAIPGGFRSFRGGFYHLGQQSTFWSSTEDGPLYSWFRGLHYLEYSLERGYGGFRGGGLSVRCLKDE